MLHRRLALSAIAVLVSVARLITPSLARDPEADYSAAIESLAKLEEQRRKDTAGTRRMGS